MCTMLISLFVPEEENIILSIPFLNLNFVTLMEC